MLLHTHNKKNTGYLLTSLNTSGRCHDDVTITSLRFSLIDTNHEPIEIDASVYASGPLQFTVLKVSVYHFTTAVYGLG